MPTHPTNNIHLSLASIKVPFSTPTMLCDNMSAIALTHNSGIYARTKHAKLDICSLPRVFFLFSSNQLSTNYNTNHQAESSTTT